jgi:kinetochore protein Nuf2
MRAVGVANWSVEENLLKPTARSVIRDLSAIINFAKFREERLAGYCDLSEQFEMLADTRDELSRQREQRVDELDALK